MNAIKKKQKPVNSKEKKEKNKARAFLNWSVLLKSGGVYRCKTGLPIYPPNPKYPNPQEDWLVDLAKRNGGEVEITMRVKVRLYQAPSEAPSMDDVEIG